MQAKSLLTIALLLVASPSMYACTVTDGADEDTEDAGGGNADDVSSDDSSDEPTESETEGTSETEETETEDTVTGEEPDAGPGETEEGDGGETTEEGDGGETTDEGDGGETTDEGDGGETTDEGDGGETTEEGDGGGAGGDTFKSGSVGLTQSAIVVGDLEIVSSSASASFGIATLGGGSDGPLPECTTKTEGSCTLTECEVAEDPVDPGTGGSYEAVSAGDITITGISEDVTLSSNDEGTYAPASGSAKYWEGGETLVATAAGSDDVPEFSVELTAPSDVSLTSPEIDLVNGTEISRAESLEVVWTEGEDGMITVNLIDTSDEEISRSIACAAPVSAGSVTIDSSLLEGFGEDAVFSSSVSASTLVTVEDWSVTLSAMSPLSSGTVTITD